MLPPVYCFSASYSTYYYLGFSSAAPTVRKTTLDNHGDGQPLTCDNFPTFLAGTYVFDFFPRKFSPMQQPHRHPSLFSPIKKTRKSRISLRKNANTCLRFQENLTAQIDRFDMMVPSQLVNVDNFHTPNLRFRAGGSAHARLGLSLCAVAPRTRRQRHHPAGDRP